MKIEEIYFLGEVADEVERYAEKAPGPEAHQALLQTANQLRTLGLPADWNPPVVVRSAPNRLVVVRIADGDLRNSKCCNSRTNLFRSNPDFAACKCSSCQIAWPLFRPDWERLARFWHVRCPGCGERMEPGRYAFQCHPCAESIRLVDLLPRA